MRVIQGNILEQAYVNGVINVRMKICQHVDGIFSCRLDVSQDIGGLAVMPLGFELDIDACQAFGNGPLEQGPGYFHRQSIEHLHNPAFFMGLDHGKWYM
jgi:hypothetical protein